MRAWLTAAVVLWAAGGACLPGCASGPKAQDAAMTPAAMPDVPVVRMLGRSAGGSGIPLGQGLVLTARHILKDRWLEVNGRRARYEIVAQGEGGADKDDWAVIRTRAAEDLPGVTLAEGESARPRPGEQLCVMGYWRGESDEPLPYWDMRRLPLQCVRATAATPPWWAPGTAGLMFFEAPLHGKSYHGISGGPVAVCGPDGSWRVVGVYKGSWEVESPVAGKRTLQIAVRVPPEAVELQRRAGEAGSGSGAGAGPPGARP
jgi:hypothetical protein